MKTINLRRAWYADTIVVVEAESNTRQGPCSCEFHLELHRRLIGSHLVLEEVTARSVNVEYSVWTCVTHGYRSMIPHCFY
jgi:hypothetical protein